jgi:hypothetical protein
MSESKRESPLIVLGTCIASRLAISGFRDIPVVVTARGLRVLGRQDKGFATASQPDPRCRSLSERRLSCAPRWLRPVLLRPASAADRRFRFPSEGAT